MSSHAENESPPLSNAPHALALHVGFAGARDLGFQGLPEAMADARFQMLVDQLAETLRGLHQRLGLHAGYFPVGLSQLAIGADSVFADACGKAGVLQRVLLPQPRDGFLDGMGSTGPDFDARQKKAAIDRFEAPHVIQEWVVSNSADRRTRFRECSFEILRLSDVVITLQPKGTATGNKPGGTNEFLAAALRHRKIVLECEFAFDASGELQWWVTEHKPKDAVLPQLPALFDQPLPRAGFAQHLKTFASRRAGELKRSFERRMRVVIWAHVGATALASAALALSSALPDKSPPLLLTVSVLLVAELLLLAWGWWTHRTLHHDENTHQWATARLAAEIARSAQTLGPGIDIVELGGQKIEQSFAGQHTYLKALFDLPMPADFRALTRTLNVLHLEATLPNKGVDWTALRDRYVRQRLDTEEAQNPGQIPYFTEELRIAKEVVIRSHRTFNGAVATAILATAIKLALPLFATKLSPLAAVLSWLAIVMPVLAVAVMSISANLDKEARANTYADVLEFLKQQRTLLLNAETEPEFLRLQAECEIKLLSETLHWYYRRRFANPA